MSDVPAVIDRIFGEVVNQGKIGAIDELFAEGFVDHGPMGDMEGRDTFRQLVETWRAAVPDVHCTVDRVVTDGTLAGWTVRTTGTHTGDQLGFPATGKHFETVSANVARIEDGKVAEHWCEQGMMPMLMQLGVLPAFEPA